MYGDGVMNGWGMMGPGMWILMLLFWGLVIVGIIAGIRWLTQRTPPADRPASETPLEILKKRYARGEIDREEFERMKKDLQ